MIKDVLISKKLTNYYQIVLVMVQYFVRQPMIQVMQSYKMFELRSKTIIDKPHHLLNLIILICVKSKISHSSYVVFTVIVQNGYPLKLVNLFLDTIVTAFFDQAKTILGSHDLQSRLQSIQGSHYFVKFDRVIKQKKRQFDDPKSMKNVDRMKKQLQSIQEIMKQNMSMIDGRHKQLLETEQKARKVNEQSKQFERRSNKLKWNIWFKKNLIWIVLILAIILLGWVLL